MKDNTRLFDVIFAIAGLIFLSPFFLLFILLIKTNSTGPAIFKQERIGRNGKAFTLYKFRTMYVQQATGSLLTVGKKDNRITTVGHFLRRYKLDELPQLFNVLKNDMSFVGPRPEVKKFVDHYTKEQKKVLSIKPGITDFASIKFRNENEILAKAENPEAFYINEILPQKINLNMIYIENKTIKNYFLIIAKTIF